MFTLKLTESRRDILANLSPGEIFVFEATNHTPTTADLLQIVADHVSDFPSTYHTGFAHRGILQDRHVIVYEASFSTPKGFDPETLEAIADEIDNFQNSARTAALRALAKAQRESVL